MIITIDAHDPDGICKIELWVNGTVQDEDYVSREDDGGYRDILFDTNDLPDGQTEIFVRVCDCDGNCTDSDVVTPVVDNTLSSPDTINIISAEFQNGGFEIIWEQSQASDFANYELFHSLEETMDNGENIHFTNTIAETHYFMNGADPLVLNHFYIIVTDTFEYYSQSEIYTTSLDPRPIAVNVNSITYDISEMLIRWDESPDTDFLKYDLYISDDTTNFEILTTISSISQTTYGLSEFDPTKENYFRVTVYDTFNQSSTGNYLSNTIAPPPNPVDITSVAYDYNTMMVIWEEYSPNLDRIKQFMAIQSSLISRNLTNDFLSYELLYSETENGDRTSITTITDQYITSYSMNVFDPTHENWFWVKLSDHWGLHATGVGMSSEVDEPPVAPVLDPIYAFGPDLTITWSIATDSDFSHYNLYEDHDESMDNKIIIFSTTGINENNYISLDNDYETVYYFQASVVDHWGLEEYSNIESIDPEYITFIQHYDYENSENETGSFGIQTDTDDYIVLGTRNDDIWLIKIAEGGSESWNIDFDHGSNEAGVVVRETSDMGYLILANSSSGGDHDIWIAKTNENGSEEWFNDFGGAGIDKGSDMIITSDGSIVVIGTYNTQVPRESDLWILKSSSTGNEEWSITIASDNGTNGLVENGYSISETSDNGYIISASIETDYQGPTDVWLINADSNGDTSWSTTFDIDIFDHPEAVLQTIDGGFAIAGYSAVNGDDSTGTSWIIKTDESGQQVWMQDLNSVSAIHSMIETQEGDLLLTGGKSSDSDIQAWLIKTSSNGDVLWERTYGGDDYDISISVGQTSDNGFVMVGTTNSYDTESDVLHIKTDPSGNVIP